MITIEERKKEFLELLGVDDETDINAIEEKLKIAIRNPKINAKTWNFLFRGADLFGIDLSDEVKAFEEEKHKESAIKELYEEKGTTIFTLIADHLGVPVEEVKAYPYEEVIEIAKSLVPSYLPRQKNYTIVTRGINKIEDYINMKETNNDSVNKSKK